MVTASRKFVCIRPKSFEDPDESAFLLSILKGRKGGNARVDGMVNTVFTIFDSQGDKQLVRSGRSPNRISSNAADFASVLNEIARDNIHDPKAKAKERSLPLIKDLRLAMNVAACDSMPLVVHVGKDEREARRTQGLLAPLAWSDEFVGQFRWVSLTSTKTLAAHEGMPVEPGLYVVQPDEFGVTCKVLAKEKLGAGAQALRRTLTEGLEAFDSPRIRRRGQHVREGERKGYSWEHAVKQSEPGALTGKRD